MKLSWRRQSLRTRHVFATSRGGIREKQTLIVALEHSGVTGLGEIVASDLYGQSLEASEAALREIASDAAGNAARFDPFAVESWIAYLIQRHDGQRALVAGLDSALHDWAARRVGLPVWRWLGLDRPSVETTFTLGVSDAAETREKLAEALAAGYTALKVKVGTPRDEEALSIVRERFAGPLLLDANEGWNPDEAAGRIRALARFKPAMIEQPLSREHWREMATLRALGVAPIFADEDCQRPADVVRLHGFVDGINIKLNKCGGMRQAFRMVVLARELGMRVMLGCFVSSSLAIAPALTIASLVDYADLDGHLLLADDPFEGIARDGSRLSLGDAPGLGVAQRPPRESSR